MKFFPNKADTEYQVTRAIVLKYEPLSDKEIDQALIGAENTQWYKAIVQILIKLRLEHSESGKAWSAYNNPLGLARDVGAQEACDELLFELSKRQIGD